MAQEENRTDSENDENQHIFKLSDDFEIKSILGQGVFGKVYSALSIKDKIMVALKIIKKKEYSIEKLNVFRYEESIVSQLNHENVINFYMSKETPKLIIMAMGLAQGENLKEFFRRGEPFDETMIRNIMKGILHGIEYIHSKKIVHRDIKPENIIMKITNNELQCIKLVDFGLSFQMLGSYLLKDPVGTPVFFAPEAILKKPYSQLIDIWSCGIVFYMLFSQGKHPFYTSNMPLAEFTEKVLNFECAFPPNMDSKAIDLFKKMCHQNPEERLDASQALNHPWITGRSEIVFNPIEKLRIFNKMEKMMEILKAVIVLKHLSKVSTPVSNITRKRVPTIIKISPNLVKKPDFQISVKKPNRKTMPTTSSHKLPQSESSFSFDNYISDLSGRPSPDISPGLKFKFELTKKKENNNNKMLMTPKVSLMKKSEVFDGLENLNFGNLSTKKNFSCQSSIFCESDSKDKRIHKNFSVLNKMNYFDEDLLKSTRSLTNYSMNNNKKEEINSKMTKSEEKHEKLPLIHLKIEEVINNKPKSTSCFTRNEEKLPMIHKSSRFKAEKK